MKKITKLFALLAALLLCLTFTACGRIEKIDMSPYLSVSYTGYNGNGTAHVDFDFSAFEYNTMAGVKLKDQFEKFTGMTAVEMTITYAADKAEKLSNGDTITVTVSVDEQLAKKHGFSFKGMEKKFKVEGLTDPIMVDPFAEGTLDIVIEGTAPFASLYLNYTGDRSAPAAYITYKADKTYNLKNGDVVTVTAEMNERYAQQGYLLTADSMTVTVEGLKSYITDVSALRAEDIAAIRGKAAEYWEKKKDDSINICTVNGKEVNMSPEKVGFCSDLRFDDTGYAVIQDGWGTTTVMLLPFHVDVQDVAFSWWNNDYYEDPLIKSFPNAAGYFAVTDLVLDENGQLIRDSFHIDITYFYESEQQLLEKIDERYGMDTICKGTFAG